MALYPAAALLELGVVAGATTRYAVKAIWFDVLILAVVYSEYRALKPRQG